VSHASTGLVAVVGHIVPGIFFTLWGILWFRRANRNVSPFGPPIEKWIVAGAVVLGVFIELGYAGWTLTEHSVMNYQHSTMYVAFALPSLLQALAERGRVSARLPYAVMAGAFAIAGTLFVAHGNPNRVSEAVHVLMAIVFFGAGVMSALEAKGPPTAALAFGRSWLTVGVGVWFIIAAWVLGVAHYDFDSVAVVLRVRLFFIWDVGITGLTLAIISSWSKPLNQQRRNGAGAPALSSAPGRSIGSDSERLRSISR
jgi:hypothetical protein